jgi:hypothetical protein
MTKTENRAAAKAYQQEKERRWREEAHAANVAPTSRSFDACGIT